MSGDQRRRWAHPIFLNVDGLPVVVIGGGTVAERKIETLLESGACITVVSPEVTDAIAARGREGRVAIQLRPYRTGDLAACRLAYAATSDPEVNRAVRDEAQAEGVWLNAVDKPDLCDFISPAIVRRGDLTLAVSTSGRCPALAKRIREDLEREYGPEYAALVEQMGEARDRDRAGAGEASEDAPAAHETVADAASQLAEQGGAGGSPCPAPGTVYLVGAGPGDPELLTIKGRRLLECVDTVVYDALVDPRLLDLCLPSALRFYVGKRSGCHVCSQDEINALLIAAAKAGRSVVRLKGGDPFLFGRGGEEADALAGAGVAFEVVPGVSAGVAVPAYAGIPLTHRGVTAEVVFVTGHDSASSPSAVDWSRYADSPATLVVFMGLDNLQSITRQLLAHGRDESCPAAVIARGTTSAQQTVVGTLSDIAAKAAAARVQPPALIVVGEVVDLREKLEWFERRRGEGKPPALR
jgi:uroporphyrin-III C-methyltransferase/precorrin-2 dehydrogenase/sirohydrochlorin ferrochelatase